MATPALVRASSTRVPTAIGFAVGLVAALVASAAIVFFARFALGWSRFDMSRPSVVHEIQNLRRLETVVFAMDKIVAGERSNPYLPRFLVGDRVLLIAYGEVTAGVDLGAVTSDDISLGDESVTLKLPSPAVFAARIDNSKTRVYSRETGLFTTVDPNLESEVRQEAERQIRQAALDSGILRVAGDNARTTLTSLLRALGFREVVFQ